MIIPNYFEDIHTLHQGIQPNRAYYIPASIPMDCLVEHREQSDRFQLLNGQWKFRYCESVHDFSERFFEPDFDCGNWDTIPVPSVWQNHGFDQHQYTNIRYPFPADPPLCSLRKSLRCISAGVYLYTRRKGSRGLSEF